MENAPQPDLRLILVARKGEEKDASEAIKVWRDAFSQFAPHGISFCLWLTGEYPSVPEDMDACVHALHLNPLIDGYQRKSYKRMTWSPWGQKSGPNYQFFTILGAGSQLHKESWILQLELDNFPLRKLIKTDLSWIFDSRSELWVVGSENSVEVKKYLSKQNQSHINGAAFYRVGSGEFRAFWNRTWALSLLDRLRHRPATAYDVMNSPLCWEELPVELRESWSLARNSFQSTAGMLNAPGAYSGFRFPHTQGVIGQPWFLHGIPALEDQHSDNR